MLRATLLCLVLVGGAACGGASRASSRADGGGEARTISKAWLSARPSMSPWGVTTIPASRKPRWFCRTEMEQLALSSCARTEESCRALPGEAPCDPHARAACLSPGDGRCFPTLASCEAARTGGSRRAAVAVAADPAPARPAPRQAPPPSPSPSRAAVTADPAPRQAAPTTPPPPRSGAVVAADPAPSAATCAWSE